MHRALLIALTLAALLATGCGQSKQDKAKSQVCDARADISKQVGTLKNLTITTATADQVSKSLQSIRDDLSKIAGAQGDLADSRKAQVQSANEQFTSQVKNVVTSVGRSLSLGNAKQQLTTALQQLATSYQQTFAKIDCG